MTSFGIDQLSNETPKWAKWMFGITFLVTTSLATWIAATNIFPQTTKYELTIFLKVLIDPIIYGISHMFGIEKEDK